MAKVRIEEILDQLSHDLTRALDDALVRTDPENEIDARELFREFKRAVGRKCRSWETVRDSYVDTD